MFAYFESQEVSTRNRSLNLIAPLSGHINLVPRASPLPFPYSERHAIGDGKRRGPGNEVAVTFEHSSCLHKSYKHSQESYKTSYEKIEMRLVRLLTRLRNAMSQKSLKPISFWCICCLRATNVKVKQFIGEKRIITSQLRQKRKQKT